MPGTPFAGALRNSLDYLPERPFKDFCVWVLSQPEYRSRWLQLVGIESLIRMNTALLDGLLEDDESARLTAYGAPLLVYLTYEAISDNLAIGLAGRDLDDAGCAGRAGLLCTFNDAMLARLGGASAHDRILEQGIGETTGVEPHSEMLFVGQGRER